MVRRSHVIARFEQTLTYLDGPQLIVLKADERSKIVAVAIDRIADVSFFGAKVSNSQFESYLNNQFDLRYLLIHADREKYYQFDLPQADNIVLMNEIQITENIISRFAPEHGLFAVDHSDDYAGLAPRTRYIQKFFVDGHWSMPEFGRFNAQMSDLYALTKSAQMFSDGQTDDESKRAIAIALVKPFQGGGSYLSMFRSLAKVGGAEAKPDIKAIQWASPGYIEVLGNKRPFDEIIALVNNYSVSDLAIALQYDHLWSYLQENKLLKAKPLSVETNSPISVELNVRSKELAKLMGLDTYETICEMAHHNALIVSKVTLAVARRIKKLHAFFAEGRLSVDDSGID